MADYRFSVIPAGAITDPRLCLRDLQVLALLGRHNHKGGWMFRNQCRMAVEIDCHRRTIQRSIDRLVESGWVERRLRGIGKTEPVAGSQPFAAYWYRIVMDNSAPPEPDEADAVDEEEFSTDDEIEASDPDGRCDSCVNPSDDTGVTSDDTGVARGAHMARTHKESTTGESVEVESGETDAQRNEAIKREAMSLAEKIGKIVGLHSPDVWTPEWCGAPGFIDSLLREGYPSDLLFRTARAVVATYKGPGSIRSIRYFTDAFARAHAMSRQELPDLDLIEPGKANHAANRNGVGNSRASNGESFSERAIRLARLAAGDFG